MVGAAPTAAKGRLSHRSAAAPRPAWSGATSTEPTGSGCLPALCLIGAVLPVAIGPAAAQARSTTGAVGDEQPRLWGVEVNANVRAFARPTNLVRMKHGGINAVVV